MSNKISDISSNAPNLNLPCIRDQIAESLELYLAELANTKITNLYSLTLEQLDLAIINVSLKHTNGNLSKTAELLGMSRSTLRNKMNKLEIK